ncbi:reverse transcriptase [Phytophthora megakarya]|uniref:Reverse transcriptase n=1 Tax=Phytophthora megakarya TaxID=4795 RepID=A0A225WFN4_9STRA|nr:reverse transcriptase [Phytophthora megakarya]
MQNVLTGDVSDLPRNRVKKIAMVSDPFVLDSREILYGLSTPTPETPATNSQISDSWSERRYVRTCYTTCMKNFKAITMESTGRLIFYWIVMYVDVQKFFKVCVDCASAMGRPPVFGPSPGNIKSRYPFEVVSMDFVTELPESHRGNTYLLLFQDQFPGNVMTKSMLNTEAQAVAGAYVECVFRRFGVSSGIKHNQYPRFLSKSPSEK